MYEANQLKDAQREKQFSSVLDLLAQQ